MRGKEIFVEEQTVNVTVQTPARPVDDWGIFTPHRQTGLNLVQLLANSPTLFPPTPPREIHNYHHLGANAHQAISDLLRSAALWWDSHADNVVIETGADLKLVETYRAKANEYRTHEMALCVSTNLASPVGNNDIIEHTVDGLLPE